MRGYAAIQLETESFQRLFAGVTLSLLDETEQALLYKEDENPEEILVLESVKVNVFAGENGLQAHGFVADGNGRFIRATLNFRPFP